MASAVLRCTRCSDVIGVYEPVIVVDARGVRRTSLAAENLAARIGEARYHLGCYEAVSTAGFGDESPASSAA